MTAGKKDFAATQGVHRYMCIVDFPWEKTWPLIQMITLILNIAVTLKEKTDQLITVGQPNDHGGSTVIEGKGSGRSNLGASQYPCPSTRPDSFSNNFTNICSLSTNPSLPEHHLASKYLS